jgi:hypothetical protein
LDFDGVLHPEPCYDVDRYFIFLPRLESVLREFSNVKIVISSTWRESHSLSELKKYFSPDIAELIIGVTPHWQDIPEIVEVIGYQRHAEIEAWIRQSSAQWENWVAIDDKPYLFKPFLNNLLKTNSLTGFDETVEKILRTKLLKN